MVVHPIYRVRGFEIVSDYTLRIRFDDGTEQTIDFHPILRGKIYGPLRDLEIFNQVRIDPEVETLVWPNGADFDPATLHDWPAHEQAFATWCNGGKPCKPDVKRSANSRSKHASADWRQPIVLVPPRARTLTIRFDTDPTDDIESA